MSEETKSWKQELMEKYDDIFQNRRLPMSQTCMCWGLEVGDGWRALLTTLCEQLTYIKKLTGVQIVADQVKEKFGTLRFYYHTICPQNLNDSDDALRLIDTVIGQADGRSECTCELCGEWGTLRTDGWYAVRCDECYEKEHAKVKPDPVEATPVTEGSEVLK